LFFCCTQYNLHTNNPTHRSISFLRGLVYGVLIGEEEESHGDVHEQ
jgi:hypothetical protein